ncbi:MAG: VC0807 family protein [Coraliomargarita sp.]
MPEQQPSTSSNPENSAPAKAPAKQENVFLNLGCNLILPIMMLKKGEKWFGSYLEPYFDRVAVGVLLIAIAFPIGYFIFDLIKRSKFNFVSIVGLVSVLLTGLFGVLELPVEWFALKEAALPLAIGIGIAASIYTKNSFFKAIVLNPDICNVDRITVALQESQKEAQFEKLLRFCNWVIVVSMGLSVILNFILARWIVVSPTGTEAFNDEVAKMMWVSMIVIMIPSMALMIYAFYRLMSGITQMTGLKLEDIMHGADNENAN